MIYFVAFSPVETSVVTLFFGALLIIHGASDLANVRLYTVFKGSGDMKKIWPAFQLSRSFLSFFSLWQGIKAPSRVNGHKWILNAPILLVPFLNYKTLYWGPPGNVCVCVGGGGGGVHFPLFPKIKILIICVPCSPKLPLFPCNFRLLFPWNKWPYPPVPPNPWEGLFILAKQCGLRLERRVIRVYTVSLSSALILYRCCFASKLKFQWLQFTFVIIFWWVPISCRK